MKYNVCTMNTHAPLSRRRRARLARSLATAIRGKEMSPRQLVAIRDLEEKFGFSLVSGEIQLLNGKWYVTHAGLLRLAQRKRCKGIQTVVLRSFQTQQLGAGSLEPPFTRYGAAEASSVTEMLILQMCLLWSVAPKCASLRLELSTAHSEKPMESASALSKNWVAFRAPPKPPRVRTHSNGSHSSNGSSNGQPRLRDQLCLLIRQHNLDPTLVKAYAADFCGTQTLTGATGIWLSPSSPTSLPQRKKTSMA